MYSSAENPTVHFWAADTESPSRPLPLAALMKMRCREREREREMKHPNKNHIHLCTIMYSAFSRDFQGRSEVPSFDPQPLLYRSLFEVSYPVACLPSKAFPSKPHRPQAAKSLILVLASPKVKYDDKKNAYSIEREMYTYMFYMCVRVDFVYLYMRP